MKHVTLIALALAISPPALGKDKKPDYSGAAADVESFRTMKPTPEESKTPEWSRPTLRTEEADVFSSGCRDARKTYDRCAKNAGRAACASEQRDVNSACLSDIIPLRKRGAQ